MRAKLVADDVLVATYIEVEKTESYRIGDKGMKIKQERDEFILFWRMKQLAEPAEFLASYDLLHVDQLLACCNPAF